MSRSEDHELVVKAVSAQDAAAFGELVRRHQSQVRNFLRKLAGDVTDLFQYFRISLRFALGLQECRVSDLQ